MAILKGDWVMVEKDTDGVGGLGRITDINFHPETHLVWLIDGSRPFAILRHESRLTKIDSAFNNLLTDVYKEGL